MSETYKLIAALYEYVHDIPVVVAVWVVDQPQHLARVRELVRAFDEPVSPLGVFGRVPVKEWWSPSATEEEWARAPVICKTPGLYMEFNNGTFARFGLGGTDA